MLLVFYESSFLKSRKKCPSKRWSQKSVHRIVEQLVYTVLIGSVQVQQWFLYEMVKGAFILCLVENAYLHLIENVKFSEKMVFFFFHIPLITFDIWCIFHLFLFLLILYDVFCCRWCIYIVSTHFQRNFYNGDITDFCIFA